MIQRSKGDAIWATITASNLSIIDETWENWECEYVISSTIGSVAKLTGTAERSLIYGSFYLRIPSSDASALSEGEYVLSCRAKNTLLDYKREFAREQIIIDVEGKYA